MTSPDVSDLIATAVLTQHQPGTGPVLDLTGAHHINTRYERCDVTYLAALQPLGMATSTHGWSVAVGTARSGPDRDGATAPLTVAVLDDPNHQRQVIYTHGFKPGTKAHVMLGAAPFDLPQLLRLPTDPTAVPEDDRPALIDAHWRRVERLHTIATGITITGAETGLAKVAEWWQLPSALGWATFPDIESADPYWDDFASPEQAHDWFERGFAAHDAVQWVQAATSPGIAAAFRAAGWTPGQAATLDRAFDQQFAALTGPDGDWVAQQQCRNRWMRVISDGAHTPQQVITAVRAGLSAGEVVAVSDWDKITVMAALRAPAAQSA